MRMRNADDQISKDELEKNEAVWKEKNVENLAALKDSLEKDRAFEVKYHNLDKGGLISKTPDLSRSELNRLKKIESKIYVEVDSDDKTYQGELQEIDNPVSQIFEKVK